MKLQLDKKSLAIGILSLTGSLLLAANIVSTPNAQAADTIRGDQYFAVTGRVAVGGDGLYLTNRDGVMVVFIYNPNTRLVEPRAIKSVVDAFNGAAPAGPGKHH